MQTQSKTMSIYKKFIDSAKKQQQQQSYSANNCGEPNETMRRRAAQRTGSSLHRLVQLPNAMSSSVSSTPLAKQHQYRRLVESSSVELGWAPARQTRRAPWPADDPVLLRWMRAMRFETELECLTALQARTLATDEHSAGALSVRNSQVAIHETRLESQFIIELVDRLIDSLPVGAGSLEKLALDFSELWARLTSQTSTALSRNSPSTVTTTKSSAECTSAPRGAHCNQLTIINCTPRKSALANARTLRPLDKLAIQIRNVCLEFAQMLHQHQGREWSARGAQLDNGQLEASLRRIKEYYGKFVEICMRAECANIVRALDYDFSNCALNRLSSNASLRPARPYESSLAQLPLKWALIALWQLTKDDDYLCRTLTERWQTTSSTSSSSSGDELVENVRPRAAKRLDYATKQHEEQAPGAPSLRSDYEKLFQICQNNEEFRKKQEQLDREPARNSTEGALSSALKSKQNKPIRQVSTIELLIDIIISQPNKHERTDVLNFIHSHANKQPLVELEELDQSVSAAIYTSNQYKVAALRILNHLCVNEQAIKTILRCFFTPPPSTSGRFNPENKIIKSIFECYQTAQEHIYQNETVFSARTARRRLLAGADSRKRARQLQRSESGGSDEFSDYGSRQTNSGRSSSQHAELETPLHQFRDAADQLDDQDDHDDDDEEGDDAVVKEAIRLLIQLTTPFHATNQGIDYYTLIGQYSVNSLVRYLTNIIKSTHNREMLLLSLSVLANISFITTEPMKMHATNRIILEIFRASKTRSKCLELRDQAVTIMANAVDKNLLDIVNNGGLAFLLSCLEICPTRMANYSKLQQQRNQKRLGSLSSANDELEWDNNDHRSLHEYADIASTGADTCSLGSTHSRGYYQLINENKSRDRKPIVFSDDVGGLLEDVLECACDHQQSGQLLFSSSGTSVCLSRLTTSELAAMERIHQKAAVAFARISADPVTTKMVLKYGGVKQMIDLCKYDHKRNYSDTVLVACIVALKRISTVIGREIFRNYNALDLIELEPRHALKIYGNVGSCELFSSEV